MYCTPRRRSLAGNFISFLRQQATFDLLSSLLGGFLERMLCVDYGPNYLTSLIRKSKRKQKQEQMPTANVKRKWTGLS